MNTTNINANPPSTLADGSGWRAIETLDHTKMDFVLVTEDGAVRLHLWNPDRKVWERAYLIGSVVQEGEDCANPPTGCHVQMHRTQPLSDAPPQAPD